MSQVPLLCSTASSSLFVKISTGMFSYISPLVLVDNFFTLSGILKFYCFYIVLLYSIFVHRTVIAIVFIMLILYCCYTVYSILFYALLLLSLQYDCQLYGLRRGYARERELLWSPEKLLCLLKTFD